MSQTSQQFALISIHASAKEATLDEQKPFKVVLYISIHASAKEATFEHYFQTFSKMISIHASAKEATYLSPVHHLCLPYFNPRLREGGDLTLVLLSVLREFQSTPPRRRRQWLVVYTDTSKEFQSTPPRRRRQDTVCCTVETPTDFNPRLREGGDAHFQR